MKFDRADMVALFRILDVRLTRPGTLRLIGGAVIGLCHLPAYRTRDIDYSWADKEVSDALTELQLDGKCPVPVNQTGVYFAPYDHENRFYALKIPGLMHLTVEVPERHDLAVMKAARGFDRDIEALAQVHSVEPFDLKTLVKRFHDTWITGPRRLADLSFLLMIESLFGTEDAEQAEKMLSTLR